MSNERLPLVVISIEMSWRPTRALTANMDRAMFIAQEAAQAAVLQALKSDEGEAEVTIHVRRKAKKPR